MVAAAAAFYCAKNEAAAKAQGVKRVRASNVQPKARAQGWAEEALAGLAGPFRSLYVPRIDCSQRADMADQIVITEKSSQAKDVRAAVGSGYGDILCVPKIRFCSIDDEGRRGQAVV